MPLVSLSTGPLRYRESGAGRPGAPVVLIHGAGMSSAVWLGTMHRLARLRHVIALDLPGHGRSAGAPESVDGMVAAVAELAQALALGRIILVGHSLGGLVALAYAHAHPDQVAGLALVTCAARLRVSPQIPTLLASAWASWPAFFAAAAHSPDTPADTRRRSAAIACAACQEQTLADFRAVAAFDGRPLLGSLRVPALVVAGEHDVLVSAAAAGKLAAGLGVPLHVLPHSGHMPMHEQPDGLAEVLATFLTNLP